MGTSSPRRTDFHSAGWFPLGISWDGTWIARHHAGKTEVQDVKTNALRQRLPYPAAGVIKYIFSPDNRILACHCLGPSQSWWDLASGKELGSVLNVNFHS